MSVHEYDVTDFSFPPSLMARPPEWSPAYMLSHVCARYNVTMEALLGASRLKTIAEARLVAYWILRQRTPQPSYPEIARIMGWRDHTTIMSGVRKIERMRKQDLHFRWMVDDLKKEALGGRAA